MEMQLYSFWFPLLLTFFVSWMVTDVFMEIFHGHFHHFAVLLRRRGAVLEGRAQPFAEGGLRSAIKVTNEGKDASTGHCLPCCGSSGGNSVAPVESRSPPPAQSTVIQELRTSAIAIARSCEAIIHPSTGARQTCENKR